jgi:hypothetical protein
MNAIGPDALAELRDIHLPEAISLWPPAPGVWVAMGLLVAIGFAIHLFLRARRRSLGRAALRELAGVDADYRKHGDAGRLALGLASLMRRVALIRFGRREVASLHGAGWADFLARTAGHTGMRPEIAGGLEATIYGGRAGVEVDSTPDEWIESARHWIRENT